MRCSVIDFALQPFDFYDHANDLLSDGLIQRFEFTFELAWKTMQAIFTEKDLLV